MTLRLRSRKNRPIHMGAYPTEKLRRAEGVAGPVPAFTPLGVTGDARPLAQATRDHRAMLDAIREGLVNKALAEIPADLTERAQHLKAFAQFNDATMVGICKLAPDHHLAQPLRNADVARLAQDLQTRQVKTLASGVDAIMADLRAQPPVSLAGRRVERMVDYLGTPKRVWVIQRKPAASFGHESQESVHGSDQSEWPKGVGEIIDVSPVP